MTDIDRERFARALVALGEVYQAKLAPAVIELYFQSLRRFEIEDIERAAPILLAEPGRKFMPKPGEIVECIEGTPTDRALRSVTRVEVAAATVGPYHSVTFGDNPEAKLIHALIEHLGGWVTICGKLTDEKQRPFTVAEFTKLHRLFEKHRPNVVMDHLPGIFETQNRLTRGSWDHGLEHQEPLYVIDSHGQSSEQKALPSAIQYPALPEHAHEAEPEGERGIPKATKELLARWKQHQEDTHRLGKLIEDKERPDSGEQFFQKFQQ